MKNYKPIPKTGAISVRIPDFMRASANRTKQYLELGYTRFGTYCTLGNFITTMFYIFDQLSLEEKDKFINEQMLKVRELTEENKPI